MIIEDLPKNTLDFTIIGSGPAGLTVAMKLAKLNKTVLVLEAGDEYFSEESQKMYDGKVIGNKYFDLKEARLRQFGGSSNHWGGACLDFSKNDFNNWPISDLDLEPFSKDAQKILNIKMLPNKKFSKNFEQTFTSTSNVMFNSTYEDFFKKNKNIKILFNCTLKNINGDKNRAVSIDLNLKGLDRKYKIKNLILASGGIENSRLLLWSQKNSDTGFLSDLNIGKNWMEHPIVSVGYFIPNKKLEAKIKTEGHINLIPTEENLSTNKINNVRFKLFLFEDNHNQSDKHKEMIREFLCLAPTFSRNLVKNIFNKELHCAGGIVAFCEQLPKKNNQITLSNNEKDKLGIPKPNLYWTVDESLKYSLKRTLDILAEDFLSLDIGRIGQNEFIHNSDVKLPEEINGGYHHMGGTPMGINQYSSVCDKNLKIYNTSNLFLAGSSVFPTGSHANPTYHIVRLSLRLAKHLSELT